MNVGNYSEALEQQVRLLRQYREGRGGWMTDSEAPGYRGKLTPHDGEYIVSESLRNADSFFCAPLISTMLGQVSSTVPASWVLTENELPCPIGFMWLGAALRVPPVDEPCMLGFSWAFTKAKTGKAGVYLVFYGSFGDAHPSTPAANEIMYWAFEDTLATTLASDDLYGRGGWDPWHREQFVHKVRFTASAFAFLNQRILTTHRQLAERHARKRLEREGWQHEPLIRVVELRRREHVSDKQPVASVDRDWQCQWVVRGHWRQQWYAKTQHNQPIWITPYVKGPEDKPLKPPRATVFAVVR